MNNHLKIATYNVRGLNDIKKRKRIFEYLNLERYDLVALQETHFTSKDTTDIVRREWDGTSVFAPGGYNSRGVGILISSRVNGKIIKTLTDKEGRIIAIDLKIFEQILRIITVYVPNKNVLAKQFIDQLYRPRYCQTSHPIILLGDFNFTIDLELDRICHTYRPPCKSIRQNHLALKEPFTQFTNDARLSDAFRKKYPDKTDYTCYIDQHKTGTRIDRIHLSPTLSNNIIDIFHIDLPFSDHRLVRLDISIGERKTGNGYWKLNTVVLQDKHFILDLEATVALSKQNILDPESCYWNDLKENIKEIAIIHSTRLADNRRKEIRKLETLAANTDDPLNKEQILKEIQLKVDHSIEGRRVRTKINALNSRDRPTKFLLRIEKGRGDNKFIDQLKDGNIVNSSLQNIKDYCYNHFKNRFSVIDNNLKSIGNFIEGIPILTNDQADICAKAK